jgi:hypothetical protein
MSAHVLQTLLLLGIHSFKTHFSDLQSTSAALADMFALALNTMVHSMIERSTSSGII